MIVESSIKDLPDISHCHKRAFPKSLSSHQGDSFIQKMLEWYIVDKRGILFHLRDSKGNVIGYCGGIITLESGMAGAASCISQFAMDDFIKSYLARPWLLFHHDTLKRIPLIIRNILAKMGIVRTLGSLKSDKEDFRPYFGLVVIGVAREHHGQGYGSALLKEFEVFGRRIPKVERILLTVDRNNLKAIKSYEANGWTLSQEYKQSLKFKKDL